VINQEEVVKHQKAWQDEVNSLCHEIFFNSPHGHRLLALWEQKYFYGPVADPAVSVDYARFYEGRNNFIRGIRVCAYAAMQPKDPTHIKQEIEHERQDA
jgi:hypothetical protein